MYYGPNNLSLIFKSDFKMEIRDQIFGLCELPQPCWLWWDSENSDCLRLPGWNSKKKKMFSLLLAQWICIYSH